MLPNVERLRYLQRRRQETLNQARARYAAALDLWNPDLPEDQQDSELIAANAALGEAADALDLVESALADLRVLRVCVWTTSAASAAPRKETTHA